MAQAQKDIARSAREILSTLAIMDEIQALDIQKSKTIFKTLLKKNHYYSNITLVGLNGNVLASGIDYKKNNLADRKHFRDALATKDFAPGEYIITRVGTTIQAFPFAYPVLDATGTPKAILTIATDLTRLSRVYKHSPLPENSYIAVTDHKGVRLLYYPPKETTNPIGQPIKKSNWVIASRAQEPGILTATGSDEIKRIFAFEQLRMKDTSSPYMYVWAGVPEAFIVDSADTIMRRNLLLMLLVSCGSLLIAWYLARTTITVPINKLIEMTSEFSKGHFRKRIELKDKINEFQKLTDHFNNMANSLSAIQKRLQKSEQRLQLVFDNAPVGLLQEDFSAVREKIEQLSQNGINNFAEYIQTHPDVVTECAAKIKITAINHAALRLYHANDKKELLVGRKKTFTQESHKTFSNELIALASGSDSYQAEATIQTLDGEKRQVLRHLFIDPSKDDWSRTYVSLTDITARKKAEQERQALEEQLRQKYKMEAIGILAGGMAHNFNNNLSIILGNIELSKIKFPANEKIRGYLDNALIAVYRSRDLIKQIMSYSRKNEQVKTTIKPAALINETAQLLRATIPTTITLQLKIDENSRAISINADFSQLQECLLNLCNNATHAVEKTGKITIALEKRYLKQEDIPIQYDAQAGDYAMLSVSDTGCGMSADTMEKIFDLFFTTKAVDEGTGVGLSTVQGIVMDHSGIIKVRSRVGTGTTFELYFPIVETSMNAVTSPAKQQLLGGNEHILFVDDDKMLADIGEAILKELGYQVTTMNSSTEALKLFAANKDSFKLVITDQIMPELTGEQLIREIRKFKPGIPTIICTGYSSQVSEADASVLGADAFLMKPLDLENFSQVVRNILDGAD